jgi:hypothetical protein
MIDLIGGFCFPGSFSGGRIGGRFCFERPDAVGIRHEPLAAIFRPNPNAWRIWTQNDGRLPLAVAMSEDDLDTIAGNILVEDVLGHIAGRGGLETRPCGQE